MPTDTELDHLIAACVLLGLNIAPEWRESVRAHLRTSLLLGAAVTEFALPDEAEPAPVFVA